MIDAAILAGIIATHNVGERTPAPEFVAETRWKAVELESRLSLADKLETGDGWATRVGADVWSGPLAIGASWAYRTTGAWSKNVWFIRASAKHGPLELLGEVAPSSPKMEAKAEARLRFRHSHLILEERGWVEYHTQAKALGGYAYGVTLLVGFGH